ncbi:MAG: aminotransferase class V-fold PLP-dependent enzyme [Kofleriaceae bacterium]
MAAGASTSSTSRSPAAPRWWRWPRPITSSAWCSRWPRSRRARAAGARVHVDAVQLAGRGPLSAVIDHADSVALSSHKLGGPAGTGALVVSDELPMVAPWGGGPQERGRRPGTENVIGIAGFGAAAAAVDVAAWAQVAALGDALEAALVALGARVHGAGAPRVGGTVHVGFAGVPGELLVIALDLAGFATSTGAACSSGTTAPSPMLRLMGQDEATAREALRLSLGRATTAADTAALIAALPPILARIRAG